MGTTFYAEVVPEALHVSVSCGNAAVLLGALGCREAAAGLDEDGIATLHPANLILAIARVRSELSPRKLAGEEYVLGRLAELEALALAAKASGQLILLG